MEIFVTTSYEDPFQRTTVYDGASWSHKSPSLSVLAQMNNSVMVIVHCFLEMEKCVMVNKGHHRKNVCFPL